MKPQFFVWILLGLQDLKVTFLPTACGALTSCYDCDPKTTQKCLSNTFGLVKRCAADTHYCRMDFVGDSKPFPSQQKIDVAIIDDIAPVERTNKTWVYITNDYVESIQLADTQNLLDKINQLAPALPAELNINPNGLQKDTTSTFSNGKTINLRLDANQRVVLSTANPRVGVSFPKESAFLQHTLGFDNALVTSDDKEKRAERFVLGLNAGKKLTEEFTASRPFDTNVATLLYPVSVERSCGFPGVKVPQEKPYVCLRKSAQLRTCVCSTNNCNEALDLTKSTVLAGNIVPTAVTEAAIHNTLSPGTGGVSVAPGQAIISGQTDNSGFIGPDVEGHNEYGKQKTRNGSDMAFKQRNMALAMACVVILLRLRWIAHE